MLSFSILAIFLPRKSDGVVAEIPTYYHLPCDQSFFLHPLEPLRQPAFEAIEEFVDLRFVDDERRAEGDAVAEQGPRDETFFFGEARDRGRNHLARLEIRL